MRGPTNIYLGGRHRSAKFTADAARLVRMRTTIEKIAADYGVDPDDVMIHMTPHYPPGCQHTWIYVGEADEAEPSHCGKCGMSFTRYIHTECP